MVEQSPPLQVTVRHSAFRRDVVREAWSTLLRASEMDTAPEVPDEPPS